MSDTKELLEELDGKVSNLLSNLKETKDLSDQKGQEIEHLKQKLREKDETISLLKGEIESLKENSSGENQDDLKLKIGKMVKEIDRCISLLKV